MARILATASPSCTGRARRARYILKRAVSRAVLEPRFDPEAPHLLDPVLALRQQLEAFLESIEPVPVKPTIAFSEFEKIDVRVGTIERVSDVEGADKLLKLDVDFGDHNA